ncbi:MAG: hypothetical protein O3A10_12675 [Chloroflexi bacterium]|nr:hypothetical protein [Chloroflexota bacterium]MDA1147405.1 hypothetical protein [Chloroflexota bacterium]
MVVEVIAFVFAAVVMVWAFRSAAFAFGGGEQAGLHTIAPISEEAAMPTPDELEAKYQRTHRMHQAVLYLAGVGVVGAIVAMLAGSLLA